MQVCGLDLSLERRTCSTLFPFSFLLLLPGLSVHVASPAHINPSSVPFGAAVVAGPVVVLIRRSSHSLKEPLEPNGTLRPEVIA